MRRVRILTVAVAVLALGLAACLQRRVRGGRRCHLEEERRTLIGVYCPEFESAVNVAIGNGGAA